MTEKDDFYAKIVREGLISRKQAIKRLSIENKIHLNIIKDLFSQLNLSSSYLSI
jgi:hypothetical protein